MEPLHSNVCCRMYGSRGHEVVRMLSCRVGVTSCPVLRWCLGVTCHGVVRRTHTACDHLVISLPWLIIHLFNLLVQRGTAHPHRLS